MFYHFMLHYTIQICDTFILTAVVAVKLSAASVVVSKKTVEEIQSSKHRGHRLKPGNDHGVCECLRY